MWKEKKTWTVKLQKHEPDNPLMIVGKLKSVPRMRSVKSKRTKVTTSNSKCLTICETSGNIMRLCVNLMPVLAAAREPVDEEEGKEEEEEDTSWTSENKSETSSKNYPSVNESVEQKLDLSDCYTGLNLDTDTKQPPSPQFVLPPISQCKLAPGHCDCQKTERCHTALPPISLSEQTRNISSNFAIKGCGGDGLVTGELPDNRPWIDNPLSSKSVSKDS